MSCMAHQCKTCGHNEFSNAPAPIICPMCGAKDFYSMFDEYPEPEEPGEFDDIDDELEDYRE